MEGISGGSSSAPHPPWIELPGDVTANILRRLGPLEILDSAQKVCTTWWRVCREPSLWRVVHMKKFNKFHLYPDVVCRRAVDRSQGELIDISIEHFGTDELLQYISDCNKYSRPTIEKRSSLLKRLKLIRCDYVSPHGLTTAVKNLSLLEELHLSVMPSLTAADIETIGVSCPMLNSFEFNNRGCSSMEIDDSHALSIARNMPNLCHLSIGNILSNEGLEAILDGCPNLESLDLRRCSRVDLEGELGRRCSKQIKELRCPVHSTADCDRYVDIPNYSGFMDEFVDALADLYDQLSEDFPPLDFSVKDINSTSFYGCF